MFKNKWQSQTSTDKNVCCLRGRARFSTQSCSR